MDGGGRKWLEVVRCPRVSIHTHSAYEWRSPGGRRSDIISSGAGMPKRSYTAGVGPRAMSCAGVGGLRLMVINDLKAML